MEILGRNEGGNELPEHAVLLNVAFHPANNGPPWLFSRQSHALKFSDQTIGSRPRSYFLNPTNCLHGGYKSVEKEPLPFTTVYLTDAQEQLSLTTQVSVRRREQV